MPKAKAASTHAHANASATSTRGKASQPKPSPPAPKFSTPKLSLRDVDRNHRIIRMVLRKPKQTTTSWISWRVALELYGDATGEMYGTESFAVDYESCARFGFGTMIAILDAE